MRILVTVVHYYRPKSSSVFRSELADPSARTGALVECLAGIHQSLGSRQLIDGPPVPSANAGERHHVDILIVTTGGHHLLHHLPPGSEFKHVEVICSPQNLGYECHRLLRAELGNYDIYGYMEDDLFICDGFFIEKIAWFIEKIAGPGCILLPNRFELANEGPIYKRYIDGKLIARGIANRNQFRIAPTRQLKASYLSSHLTFETAGNPHAGCFFLTQEQMKTWASKPYFLDFSPAFCGPLESAATLGILRTFEIFKPAMRNASFLELRHLDRRNRRLMRNPGTQASHSKLQQK